MILGLPDFLSFSLQVLLTIVHYTMMIIQLNVVSSCPEGCTCTNETCTSWNYNYVNCYSSGLTSIPSEFPIDSTSMWVIARVTRKVTFFEISMTKQRKKYSDLHRSMESLHYFKSYVIGYIHIISALLPCCLHSFGSHTMLIFTLIYCL